MKGLQDWSEETVGAINCLLDSVDNFLKTELIKSHYKVTFEYTRLSDDDIGRWKKSQHLRQNKPTAESGSPCDLATVANIAHLCLRHLNHLSRCLQECRDHVNSSKVLYTEPDDGHPDGSFESYPSESLDPDESVDPGESHDPDESLHQSESVDPSESLDPVESVDPSESVDPGESLDPSESLDRCVTDGPAPDSVVLRESVAVARQPVCPPPPSLSSSSYCCPLCRHSFKRPIELANHLTSVHSEDQVSAAAVCTTTAAAAAGGGTAAAAVAGSSCADSATTVSSHRRLTRCCCPTQLYVCRLCRTCSDSLVDIQSHRCRYCRSEISNSSSSNSSSSSSSLAKDSTGGGEYSVISSLLRSGSLIDSICISAGATATGGGGNCGGAVRHNRLVCHQCGAEFRSGAIYAAHRSQCHTAPFVCHVCGAHFATVPHLNRHKLAEHRGADQALFPCCCHDTGCSASFSTYPAYQKHLLAKHSPLSNTQTAPSTGTNPHHDTTTSAAAAASAFTCPHCHKVFAKKIYLTHHQMRHHPQLLQRTFVCHVCGAQLGSASALRVHVNSLHNNNNNSSSFRCQLCGREFTRRDRLQHHTRLHTGEKPYRCRLCDRAFVQRCKLSDHMRRHRGEKRFRCPQCGKQYAANSDLRSHLRRIHNMDLVNRTHTIQPMSACLRPLNNQPIDTQPITNTTEPADWSGCEPSFADVTQAPPTIGVLDNSVAVCSEQRSLTDVCALQGESASASLSSQLQPFNSMGGEECARFQTVSDHGTAAAPPSAPAAGVILLSSTPTFAYFPIV